MDKHRLGDTPDRILAGRAGDGDVRAFEILIGRHTPLMRGYARQMLGSVAEADDAVQQAFITAWQHLPTLVDPGAVKSWLMRILNRACLDHIRARRAVEPLDEARALANSPATDPERIAEGDALRSALTTALSGLPENQHRVWLMREVADYSYDDIAEELELPVSTIRGLLARARKSLAEEMEVWR